MVSGSETGERPEPLGGQLHEPSESPSRRRPLMIGRAEEIDLAHLDEAIREVAQDPEAGEAASLIVHSDFFGPDASARGSTPRPSGCPTSLINSALLCASPKAGGLGAGGGSTLPVWRFH